MKQGIFIIAFFVAGLKGHAQQRPHYTQYILNNYILNPALSGIENYTDVKISARDQWVGINGAPQTAYLTVHGPLGKKDYKTSPTSFQIPGENPRGNAYWENYTASAPHHGIGFAVVNDQTGNYNRFSANVSYAYHLGLSPKFNLSAGFAGGITRIGYDIEKARSANPNDPALTGGGSFSRIRPDLSAGLWLYSDAYFAGVSVQQVIPQNVDLVDDPAYGISLVPHYFATTGYRFLVGEDFNLVPSVMFKYVPGSPTNPQFDLNAKLQYQDLLWAGGSYRFKDGFAAMIGLNVGNAVNVGYAYDLSQTRLGTVSRGTHELIIGFLIGNRYGDTCPRNIW